jgi:hypothetical protein
MSVEASDDLAIWHSLINNAPIISLEYKGQRLRQQRIEVTTRAKFLRLTWTRKPNGPFEVAAVNAEIVGVKEEPTRASTQLNGVLVPSAAEAHYLEYRFDAGAHALVDRVNVVLPDANSLLDAQIFSRPTLRSQDVETPWRWLAQGKFYRLQYEAQEIHNQPLIIAPTTDRYWSIRFDAQASGFKEKSPQLKIAWLPVKIVFLARGKAPYLFAFGDASADAAETSLTSVLATNNTAAKIQVAHAHILGVEEIGGVARLQITRHRDWKTVALWLSLLIGVTLLAWMAIRLLRDLNAKSP